MCVCGGGEISSSQSLAGRDTNQACRDEWQLLVAWKCILSCVFGSTNVHFDTDNKIVETNGNCLLHGSASCLVFGSTNVHFDTDNKRLS